MTHIEKTIRERLRCWESSWIPDQVRLFLLQHAPQQIARRSFRSNRLEEDIEAISKRLGAFAHQLSHPALKHRVPFLARIREELLLINSSDAVPKCTHRKSSPQHYEEWDRMASELSDIESSSCEWLLNQATIRDLCMIIPHW